MGDVTKMFGLSLESNKSEGKFKGTAVPSIVRGSCFGVSGVDGSILTSRESLGDNIVQRFGDIHQAIDLVSLCVNRMDQPSILVFHLGELSRYFAGELDAVLDGRVGFERLTFDFLQQVRSPPEEFVVRKLPGLDVGGRALGTGSTVDLVEAVHVQLPDEARELEEIKQRRKKGR